MNNLVHAEGNAGYDLATHYYVYSIAVWLASWCVVHTHESERYYRGGCSYTYVLVLYSRQFDLLTSNNNIDCVLSLYFTSSFLQIFYETFVL